MCCGDKKKNSDRTACERALRERGDKHSRGKVSMYTLPAQTVENSFTSRFLFLPKLRRCVHASSDLRTWNDVLSSFAIFSMTNLK